MSEQYETVWTGASWRDYQPPVIPPSKPKAAPVPGAFRLNQRRVAANRAKLHAALTDQWQTVSQLAAAVGMTRQGIAKHLYRAVVAGVAESRDGRPMDRFGRGLPAKEYRKRKTPQETAA